MTTCGFMCYGTTKTFEIAPICYFCYCYKYMNHDIFSIIWNTSSTWETHLKSSICAYLCNRLQHIIMYPDQDTGEDGRCACVRQVTSGQWSPAQHQCFGGERRQWLPGTQGTDTGAQSYVTLTVWSSEGLEVQDWLLKLTKWWAVSVPWYITVTIQWLDNRSSYIHVKTPCYIWVWICAGWSFP